MENAPRLTPRLKAVQSYLETEFPGNVETGSENVMVVSQGGMRHHIVLEPTFLKQCPDYVSAIRDSELVDYVLEARSQGTGRRFLVRWEAHKTCIRSSSM